MIGDQIPKMSLIFHMPRNYVMVKNQGVVSSSLESHETKMKINALIEHLKYSSQNRSEALKGQICFRQFHE